MTLIDSMLEALDVTVLLPVKDEERNLPAALASLGRAARVVVVDSHSSDATAALARDAGAEVVQFEYEPGGPKKKTWALANLQVNTTWTLLLDADERISDDLWTEIAGVVSSATALDGYYLDREFHFMSRSMRCFRPNWNMRLFRTGRGQLEDLGLHHLPGTGDNEIHEHVVVTGRSGYLSTPLLHDDYRGITPWIERHNRYATWEAHLYASFAKQGVEWRPWRWRQYDAMQRKRALRRVWVHLPGRPVMRFVVWYVLRRGFMDGMPGLIFCCLMGWYELLISVKLRELRNERL